MRPSGPEIAAARRYWTYLRLEHSNRLQICQLQAAQALLDASGLPEPFSDRALQRRLLQQMQSDDPAARLALGCLRCFISHQIQQVCLGLGQQFGERAGLKPSDLYPYLLDDPDPMADFAPYQPLSVRILQQFDPSQSSLSTWTKRLVLQDKGLNRVLLEDYGLYLVTDWGLLLRVMPERLRRLLADRLMPKELDQYCQILESYHSIYRRDRLTQRMGGARCAEPTPEQLWQMLEGLPPLSDIDPASLLKKLRQLAQHLRQLKAKPLSLELDAIRRQAERACATFDSAAQGQESFLSAYRQVAQDCLQRATDQVIAARAAYLRGKKQPKHEIYLKAMRLFHVQGQSMTEIAPQVGLTRQYQVSRLLELPELQADLHQRWLMLIGLELPSLLHSILEPAPLAQLQQELTTFVERLEQPEVRLAPESWRDHLRRIAADLPCVASLSEMIERLLEAYRAEVYSPNRSGSTGQIAICICQSLNSQAP